MKSIPPHENVFAVGKSGPIASFNLIFIRLGWPWVGEFVGFIIMFTCFPTLQNLVLRIYLKHPNIVIAGFSLVVLSLIAARPAAHPPQVQGRSRVPRPYGADRPPSRGRARCREQVQDRRYQGAMDFFFFLCFLFHERIRTRTSSSLHGSKK